MKKKIAIIIVLLSTFFTGFAQTIIQAQDSLTLFTVNGTAGKSVQDKNAAKWVIQSGKIKTTIGRFKTTDFLEFTIPKISPIKNDTSKNIKVLLDIIHKISLNNRIIAEIQVKLENSDNWVAFEPITKRFLDVTSQGGYDSWLALTYYKGIFKKEVPKNQTAQYDKLYRLHVANLDARLALEKVAQIEKFRIRLCKKPFRFSTKNDDSTWEIELLKGYVKKIPISPFGNRIRGSAIQMRRSFLPDEETGGTNGGSCPLPHGH